MILRSIFISSLLIIIGSTIAWSQDNEAETAAQGQLEAYNRQDIEGFLKWYTEDVEIYNFPDELVLKGKEKMRERYINSWNQNPNQKAEVRNRIINGNTIVDKEHVTGRSNGVEANVIAIYRIDAGKISRVYFIRE
ncbi:MAG TPA: nuclear transport factor 2 family protein [Bacteroidales bacterium]|nr:nuclear transport factor 2 family protein [Bacteroidales bacterium]